MDTASDGVIFSLTLSNALAWLCLGVVGVGEHLRLVSDAAGSVLEIQGVNRVLGVGESRAGFPLTLSPVFRVQGVKRETYLLTTHWSKSTKSS